MGSEGAERELIVEREREREECKEGVVGGDEFGGRA